MKIRLVYYQVTELPYIKWLEIFLIFKMPSYLRIKKDNLHFPATYSTFAMLTVPKNIWY